MRSFLKLLGPGLVYAGAAVGVSHLVQSTRAGALFSFDLVIFVLLANFLKLPFLEIAQRFPAMTGKSLLHGYRNMGKSYLVFFLLITLMTMFIIQAAITIVTAGITAIAFPLDVSVLYIAYSVLGVCTLLLISGHYGLLDNFIKYVIILLSAAVITSALLAMKDFDFKYASFFFNEFQFSKKEDLLFLVALIGWMPAPLDISVWHSLWACEKLGWRKATEEQRKNGFIDFYVGYIGTALLAVVFLSLGAMVMFPTGQTFEGSAVSFASQLVELFSVNLGTWSKVLITFACLATMISTTLTCLDAFSRLMARGVSILKEENAIYSRTYSIFLVLTALGTGLVLAFFLSNMKAMVDFATTLSFVVTPIIAWMNYKLFKKVLFEKKSYLIFLDRLSRLGLIFFSLFVIIYFIVKYIL